MIEKLDIELTQSVATNHCIINKVNQLVDAVNGILAAQEQYATIYNEDIVPMLTPENEEPETPTDPYAEQRKWIGKLCRFWDEKEEEKVFGILTTIDSDCGLSDMCPYWNDTTKNWFEHCEPVKDDIIYKGE